MATEKDFFISYNQYDRKIAEWIGWQLEEAGYSIVIQAWDFHGNWIYEMDRAMQECKRTIAVLSPHYAKSDYTYTEWANAFKEDAKGVNEKLLTIKVADFEPKGILGQLVYIDFVNKTEAEAKDLLLNKVKGIRGKPATKPAFELTRPTDERHQVVLEKPVFPAAIEDEDTFRRVREIVVEWRKRYVLKKALLEDSIKKLSHWRSNPPTVFTSEIDAIIKMAYQVATDFDHLPLQELKKITYYGLQIHETVFGGQAISQAYHMYSLYDEESLKAMEVVNAYRKEFGLPPEELLADKYGYELLERLLRAALALTCFDIGNLPRGFLDPKLDNRRLAINKDTALLIVKTSNDPRLYLASISDKLQKHHSFVARQLSLHSLSARLNEEDTIDLLAHDFQHLYVWQKSIPQPLYQFALQSTVLGAVLHKKRQQDWAHFITKEGRLHSITENGSLSEHRCVLTNQALNNAVFFVDPLDNNNWYVIASSHANEVWSAWHGTKVTGELNNSFWENPVFIGEKEKEEANLIQESKKKNGVQEQVKAKVYWIGQCHLKLTQLDGLPCLLLYRRSRYGGHLTFLDPTSLSFLHEPMFVEEFPDELTIASGRWLIAGMTSQGEATPRIRIWDLKQTPIEFCGGWLCERSDIYYFIVTKEGRNAFEVAFVNRLFNTGSTDNFRLTSFSWPSREIKETERFEELRMMPVSTT